MRHCLTVFLFLAGLLTMLPGCLQSKTIMTVRKDGSGTIEQTYYLAKMDFPDAKTEKTDAQWAETNASVAKSMGEGVTVKSFTPLKDRQGTIGEHIVYAFTDVTKLAVEITPGVGENIPANGFHFDFNKGAKTRLTVIMPSMKKISMTGNNEQDQNLTPDQEKAQNAGIAQLVKDMLIDFELRVDGAIVETNASAVNTSKDGIVLIHENIGALFKDEAATKMFNAVSRMKDSKEIKEKLKDDLLRKYIQIEPSEKVTIEFN